MTKRESMVFYASWLDAIRALPKAMQGDVLLSILEYGIEGKTVCKQGSVAMAMLAMVKPIIDANNKKYENGCKGGRKPNNNQPETNPKPNNNQPETYNDNVYVNVNDNGDVETSTPTREEYPEGTFVATAALYDRMAQDASWLKRVSENTQTPIDTLRKELKEFCDGVSMTEDIKELTDARKHFIAWRRKRPKGQAPTTGARPYRMMTYEQMLTECAKSGTTTSEYAPIRVRGKTKPQWVTKADKDTYQIPDEL